MRAVYRSDAMPGFDIEGAGTGQPACVFERVPQTIRAIDLTIMAARLQTVQTARRQGMLLIAATGFRALLAVHPWAYAAANDAVVSADEAPLVDSTDPAVLGFPARLDHRVRLLAVISVFYRLCDDTHRENTGQNACDIIAISSGGRRRRKQDANCGQSRDGKSRKSGHGDTPQGLFSDHGKKAASTKPDWVGRRTPRNIAPLISDNRTWERH